MNAASGFLHFLRQQSGTLLDQTLTHIGLTFLSLMLAIVIAVPLGILIAKRQRLAHPVLAFAGILQTIPPSLYLFCSPVCYQTRETLFCTLSA